MPYFVHDDQQLHYELCGMDESPLSTPILMLHGNGEDMSIFGKTIAPLMATNSFILMDSRLHGGSTALQGGSQTLHYSDMADDALALTAHLGLNEFDVLGYSDGGIVALIMASRSRCVRRVITIGANTDPSGLTLTARIMIKHAYNRSVKQGDQHAAELLRLMLEEPNITLSDLAKIIAEVTVVLGSKDRFIDRKHSERIADAIPHGSHMLVQGAGHAIPLTHPRELSEIIRTVL